MAASFTRAKGSKSRSGNATGGMNTGSGGRRSANTRASPSWATPSNAPVYQAPSTRSTFRPVASPTLYANAYPNTSGQQPARPQVPPVASQPFYANGYSNTTSHQPATLQDPLAPSNVQTSASRGLPSARPAEQTLPHQRVAAPQNPGLYQSDTSTQRHVAGSASIAPALKPHEMRSFNQPLQGYLGQVMSDPANGNANGNGAQTMPSSANDSHQPHTVDDDVSMADSDSPNGYKNLGPKGLEASRWYNAKENDRGRELSVEPARYRPPPERRPSRTPTGPIIINGLAKGHGLMDSRWAP